MSTTNQDILAQQIQDLQKQLAEAQSATPEGNPVAPVAEVIPQPVPIDVTPSPAPAAQVPTATIATPSAADFESLRQQVARMAQLISLGVQPGPGAVATEPGSPGELAEAAARASGAIAGFGVVSSDGVHVRAYIYPDGTVRLG